MILLTNFLGMKKMFWWVVLASGLVLVGCTHTSDAETLTQLQQEITTLSTQLLNGTLDPDVALQEITTLQTKYAELTQQELSQALAPVQELAQKQKLGSLPAWATNLGLRVPQGLTFRRAQSKQTTVNDRGYDSVVLVYQGDYDTALAEAQSIASGAHLFLSPEVLAAQQLLQSGTVLSGVDLSALSKGTVYTNHGLMDTKIDYLISLSVDADGLLTLEATNYQQMNTKK